MSMFNFEPPSFCENGNPIRSSENTKDYWTALKDFSYNEKSDRYVCRSPFSGRTMDMVKDTNIKKGDKLRRNFRYDQSVNDLKNKGFIIETSQNLAKNENPNKSNIGNDMAYKKWFLYSVIAILGYFTYKKIKK